MIMFPLARFTPLTLLTVASSFLPVSQSSPIAVWFGSRCSPHSSRPPALGSLGHSSAPYVPLLLPSVPPSPRPLRVLRNVSGVENEVSTERSLIVWFMSSSSSACGRSLHATLVVRSSLHSSLTLRSAT